MTFVLLLASCAAILGADGDRHPTASAGRSRDSRTDDGVAARDRWLGIVLASPGDRAGGPSGGHVSLYATARTPGEEHGKRLAAGEAGSDGAGGRRAEGHVAFDVGDHAYVDVEVTFRDGRRVSHHRVATNQTIVVREAQPFLADRVGTRWRPYLEWHIENTSWEGNPFDVAANVTFRHTATGDEHTTPMYHDPPSDWRFRFTGTSVGSWTFTTSSTDADLDGHHGTVTVTPNREPETNGFLTAFGNKWGWQGSDRAFVPQLVMYTGDAPALGDPAVIERGIETFLVEHGFNGFHVPSIAGQWFDHTNESGRVDETMENPDPVTVEALERLIAATHAAGGMVHVWMWGDHQRRQTCLSLRDGPDGAVARRLERYLSARLGPLPGWTMGFGFDLQEWAALPGRRNLVRTWANRMHEVLGWPHMLGGRMGPTLRGGDENHSAQARLNEGLDYYGYEHHRPTYDVYVAALAALPGRPVFSEDRFRIRVPPLYPDKDYDEERTRRGLYDSTLAGGVANIWGTNHPGGWAEGGASRPYPHPEWIKTWSAFFRKRFSADMEPARGLAEARCLMRPARTHYVFYQEETASVELDLSSMEGSQPAIAVDTRRAYDELPLGTLDPGKHTWNAPRASDWVIAIGSF